MIFMLNLWVSWGSICNLANYHWHNFWHNMYGLCYNIPCSMVSCLAIRPLVTLDKMNDSSDIIKIRHDVQDVKIAWKVNIRPIQLVFHLLFKYRYTHLLFWISVCKYSYSSTLSWAGLIDLRVCWCYDKVSLWWVLTLH